ncbi:unnamed protein product [Phytophthora fragariaefolia]|uniref:Unnamed protein product n=1 Tax=Phytophthora fragariaefolia TaxID=1490495 RepID=A0A9W6X860_9STRA|nr:unnamed protein product [Phytophthora fragariaefolia]
MEDKSDSAVSQSPLHTPPGVPILEESIWSDPGRSWDSSSAEARCGESAAGADIFLPHRSRTQAAVSEVIASWVRLRWRLARRLFSAPIPFITAEINIKLGDFAVTFPVIAILLVASVIKVAKHDVKGSGPWGSLWYEGSTCLLLQAAPERTEERQSPFGILIDGPYGGLSVDIEDSTSYSHFVLFAGGMGMTPIRSILNWLHNECYFQKARVIHRLRFIWSVSDSESLQALLDLDVERWLNNPKAPYLPDVLLCPTTLSVPTEAFFTEIYLTRGLVGSRTELDPQLTKFCGSIADPRSSRFYERWAVMR